MMESKQQREITTYTHHFKSTEQWKTQGEKH